MAVQPDTQVREAPSQTSTGSVKSLPQTIFISEKRGTDPAPPPDR